MLAALTWFFDIPAGVTFWQIINSQALATVVGVVVAVMVGIYGTKATIEQARSATAASESARSLAQLAADQGALIAAQQAKLLEDQEEQTMEVLEPGTGRDFRNDSKSLVEQAKGYLESKVDADPDGRHKRTYGAITRYDYTPLAVALSVRQQISNEQLDGAVTFFTQWRAYERGKAARKIVPESVYLNLQQALSKLKGGA
jgi:hypothetical protein